MSSTRHRRGNRGRRRGRRKAQVPGAAPGTIVIDPESPRPRIHVFRYGPGGAREQECTDTRELAGMARGADRLWVNVDGLGDAATIVSLGEVFGMHRLALEDVVNVHQRPKVEIYGSAIFVVTRMIHLEPGGHPWSEQVSMHVRDGLVLTFQEREGDCLDAVRARLRDPRSRLLTSGSDYLAYAILDAVIDAFFPVMEAFGDRLEELEDETILDPTRDTLMRVHDAKRELIGIRRAIWPQREMVSSLMREGTPLVTDETRLYLRDSYDHTIRIIDLLENYRELASSLMDVYLSSVSNRMNEVMKVLTIIATIFIPLTFIAGIYGMNFDREASAWNMPELGWAYGYPACIAVMLLTTLALLWFFRRKGWLGAIRLGPSAKSQEEARIRHDHQDGQA